MRQVHQDAGKSLTGKHKHAEQLPKHVSRRLFFCLTSARVNRSFTATVPTVMIPECAVTRKCKGIMAALAGVML